MHPRIFFSPEDLPGLRKRLKEDRGASEAWKNILAWSHALKQTYDEKADYAQPDWANGGFLFAWGGPAARGRNTGGTHGVTLHS